MTKWGKFMVFTHLLNLALVPYRLRKARTVEAKRVVFLTAPASLMGLFGTIKFGTHKR